MMGIELPLLSAVVAACQSRDQPRRLRRGVPLSLLIEAPIIMLLTASTKLAATSPRTDACEYDAVGGGLSLHLLIAVTPMFDFSRATCSGRGEFSGQPTGNDYHDAVDVGDRTGDSIREC